MAKRDDNPQRLNLIVPLELLEELRKIAKERFNSKPNHKTGYPEISQTMLKLIRLGIEAVINEDDKPPTLNDKFDGLARQFGGLADELERVKERVKELEGAIHTPSQAIQIENKEPILTSTLTPIQIDEDDEDKTITVEAIEVEDEGKELSKKKGNSKITEQQKKQILALYRETDHTTSTIADLFSVNTSTISRRLEFLLPSKEYKSLVESKRLKRGHEKDLPTLEEFEERGKL